MSDGLPATPRELWEKADQCFRLARHTTDKRVRDSLTAHARDLLKRAHDMER